MLRPVSDGELRDLERRWRASGAVEDEARWHVARVRAGQIPPGTQVWWDGAPGWQAFDPVPGTDLGGVAAAPTPAGSAPMSASQALMSGLSDQELDDEFIGLVGRSWALY